MTRQDSLSASTWVPYTSYYTMHIESRQSLVYNHMQGDTTFRMAVPNLSWADCCKALITFPLNTLEHCWIQWSLNKAILYGSQKNIVVERVIIKTREFI